MPQHNYRIFISAGEASGDLHGANLLTELNKISTVSATAMGSQKLAQAGAKLIVDSSQLAVIGLVEVLTKYMHIKSALNTIKRHLVQHPPDLIILIDYAEFNLKLAEFAKKQGIKVMFYISPQVWAWRSKRIQKIGKIIDAMAVVFPFEVELYQKNNIPVRYVGHPLANKVRPEMSAPTAIKNFNLTHAQQIITLLPGSRNSEVKRNFPIMLKTAKLIKQQLPHAAFLVPIAHGIDGKKMHQLSVKYGINDSMRFSKERAYSAINCADAAIVASGTATLETALLLTPFSIVYVVNPVTFQIFKRLIEIDLIGLANIVAKRQVAPEFVQDKAQAKMIAQECIRQINDADYRNKIIEDLKIVAKNLKSEQSTGSIKVAQMALDMLHGKAI